MYNTHIFHDIHVYSTYIIRPVFTGYLWLSALVSRVYFRYGTSIFNKTIIAMLYHDLNIFDLSLNSICPTHYFIVPFTIALVSALSVALLKLASSHFKITIIRIVFTWVDITGETCLETVPVHPAWIVFTLTIDGVRFTTS